MRLWVLTLVIIGVLAGAMFAVLPADEALAVRARDYAACDNMLTDKKIVACRQAVASKLCEAIKGTEERAACVDKAIKKFVRRRDR